LALTATSSVVGVSSLATCKISSHHDYFVIRTVFLARLKNRATIERHERLFDQYQYKLWNSRASYFDYYDRARELSEMEPRTAAGAGALFLYVVSHETFKYEEWTVPALTNATRAAKNTNHADAELFDLMERLLQATRNAKPLGEAQEEADKLDCDERRVDALVKLVMEKCPDPLKVWEQRKAAARELFDARDATWAAALDVCQDLRNMVADYRAVTIDGILIKKRSIAAYRHDKVVDVDDSDDTISNSIDLDLRRLAVHS
jgi:hypothetical protein